ncbi:MAG TPA: type I-E CRISPR-associated protein Cas5/CasD [Candidatus Kryptonia bacterium]
MSTEKKYLALRLEGPFQSWGFDSQYNRRNTGLMPTKSAIAGICCAALGYPRGSNDEKKLLTSFASLRMTAIAIPRPGTKSELPVRRLQDYHTVQNTKTAEGKIKDTHITHRQYLTDAAFGVLLEGEATLLDGIATALKEPKWGIWLGRKSCIPSAPVLAGLSNNQRDALRLLIGEESIDSFERQEEVDDFAEGRDSLPDIAVSFAIEKRSYSPRRVALRPKKESNNKN